MPKVCWWCVIVLTTCCNFQHSLLAPFCNWDHITIVLCIVFFPLRLMFQQVTCRELFDTHPAAYLNPWWYVGAVGDVLNSVPSAGVLVQFLKLRSLRLVVWMLFMTVVLSLWRCLPSNWTSMRPPSWGSLAVLQNWEGRSKLIPSCLIWRETVVDILIWLTCCKLSLFLSGAHLLSAPSASH